MILLESLVTPNSGRLALSLSTELMTSFIGFSNHEETQLPLTHLFCGLLEAQVVLLKLLSFTRMDLMHLMLMALFNLTPTLGTKSATYCLLTNQSEPASLKALLLPTFAQNSKLLKIWLFS